MALTNNLKKQVDLPVWEWCRLAPAVSSSLSASCTADNSLYHVTFGRYIYYYQSAGTLATTTGLTGFFRYDTISDSYQNLSQPPITNVTYTGMQFAGGQGYWGFVLGNGGKLNTLQIAGLTGKSFKSFDIRITSGTGIGQQRIITDVADPVIWDNGTFTSANGTPQNSQQDTSKNWILNQWVGYQVRFVSNTGQSQIRKIIYNNSNTLVWGDVAKFAEDQWADAPVTTIGGSAESITNAGSMYQIESSVITVDTNWSTMPDTTSRFVVRGGGIWMISQGVTYALQYYDVLADMWYIRNAGAVTSPVQALGNDVTIVNSGENATVWDRGVATGTQSTVTLQDTTKSWTTNQWAGYYVRIFSGMGEGQYRQITGNTNNTLTVAAWTTITPDATTRYFIDAFDMGTLSSINLVLPAAVVAISSTLGVNGTSTITVATAVPTNCNGWYVSGAGITPTTTISSGQGTTTLTLSNSNAGTVSGLIIISPVAISATAASGVINTYAITTSGNVPANCNGWYISGTGIGIGARIVAVPNLTSLTLSVANTATVSGTLYLYPVMPRADVFSAAATGSGASMTITLTALASPVNCQGWYVSGTGVANGAIVTAGQGTTGLTVSIANAGPVSGNVTLSPTILSGTATGGSGGTNTITVNDTTPPFCNGWYVSGTGIAAGTTIVSGQNSTSLTLSANNTGTVSGTLTYSLTSVSAGMINGSVLTAGATTGVYYPGQVLLGTGTQATKTILSAPAECYTTGAVAIINFAESNPIALGIQVGMIASINSIVGLPGQAGSGTFAAVATGPNYVTAVSANTVTLSTAVATALVNVTLQFTIGWSSNQGAHTAGGSFITLVGGGTTTGLYPGMYVFVGGGLAGTITAGTYVAQVIDATHFTLSQAPTVILSGTGWLWAQGYQTVIQSQLSGIPGGAGTYSVFPSQLVSSASIIGTGVSIITDTTKSWPANRWTNYAVRIRTGTGMGQIRQILGTTSNGLIAYTSAAGATNVGTTITATTGTGTLAVNQLLGVISGTGAFAYGTYVQSIIDPTHFIASAAPTTNLASSAVITGTPNNTLVVYPAWTTPPDVTSVYAIHGDSDKNYFSMAAQTPTFIHNIEADTVTTGRQLDRGVARGVSAQLADYEPVAVASGVPVLQITGGTGYIAGVAVVSGSTASNVATILYSTAVASAVFPIGSWITMVGQIPTAYVGTWQVINSSVGSVSFYLTGAPAAISTVGTVGQAASFNLAVGSLAAGNWMQIGNGTTLNVTGCVPATFNGALTVAANVGGGTSATFGGWQATGVSGSAVSTFSVSSTVGLVAGAIPTVTAGSGSFPVNTYIVSFTTNTFTINTTATLSGATVTVVPSVAVTSTTAIGNLVTLGVAQVAPKASTVMAGSGSTVTVTVAANVYPVGSWIVVTGAVPGTYNGVYQVTGGSAGTTVTYANATTVGATTQCLIGPAATTLLVTTVNNHIFQTGQVIAHKGDQGWMAAVNNIAAPITVMTPAVGTSATQYTYAVGAPTSQMVVYSYSTTVFTTLCDGTKNWVPNQWAGCQVSFNSTQLTAVALPIQPTVLSCYILANTSNTLIFAAANTVAPIQGVSRYVITAPASFGVGSIIGGQDYGLMQGVQSATSIQDVTKSWIMPAPTAAITVTTTSGTTCLVTGSMNGILIGMTVVVNLGNTTLAPGTVVNAISGTTLTLSNSFVGAGATASLIFAPTASSSGTTVTVTGYPLVNLAPGMKLAMTAVTNMSSQVLTTGAFVLNGGVNFTPVTVTGITGPNTFTISQALAVPLQNATIQATFWVPGQWINRRLRVTSGSMGANVLEGIVSSNNYNTLTLSGGVGITPASGQYGYAILQQPVIRGVGTAIFWNFGASNPNTIGKYLYQPRGGNLAGWDRINLSTDKWEFLMPTPSFEPANTGFMAAYDGSDRIYFTVQVTQRVYYFDIENNVIHAAGMYPYAAGTAIVGNRMEIFETVDGLKYLWLNRHSNMECFRQLLWY